MTQRKAFTLVELLVVVAIIALLLSILLPSLNRARDLARDVVCLSNMKQLGLATSSYASENADMFPIGNYYAVTPRDFRNTWDYRLTPHMGHEVDPNDNWRTLNYSKLFVCPRDWRGPVYNYRPPERFRSYAASSIVPSNTERGILWNQNLRAQGVAPPTTGSIAQPAATIWLHSYPKLQQGLGLNAQFRPLFGGSYGYLDVGVLPTFDRLSGGFYAGEEGNLYPHGMKVHYLFADSHAAAHDPREAFEGGGNWWDRDN